MDDRPVLLALRALKLGDLLVAVPALKGLRRGFPEHRIDLAAPGWLAPIIPALGAVDRLVATPGLDRPLAVPPGSVDVAVNLHGRGPESRLLLDRLRPALRIGHADGRGWHGPQWRDGIHERLRWARLTTWHGMPADPDDVSLAPPAVASAAPGATVVHVGAAYGSRHWPVDRFAVVAAAARELFDAPVVVTGGPQDVPRAKAVVSAAGLPREAMLAGSLALDEFAAVVASAGRVVSVDTGAAHLASAYRRPSVVLFGPAPPEEWGPPPGPHLVLTDASRRRGDVFAPDPDPALLAVTADEVVAALSRLPPPGLAPHENGTPG